MPKKVDHDKRRADIAVAAFRVIGRKGVAGATIRDIARETGYSVGAIVHYI
jgi:AcrR family transcriptional regulator